jgi:cytochrome c peroxidase
MIANCRWIWCAAVLIVACGDGSAAPSGTAPSLNAPLASAAAVVGEGVSLDVRGGFTDRKNQGLTYTATFQPATTPLRMAGGHIVGIPETPGVVRIHVLARDVGGDTIGQTVSVVVFAAGLKSPTLPFALAGYSDARSPIPPHYGLHSAPGGSAISQSNAPAANVTTDAGATLGRVLFHDRRLSGSDRVSCASCHLQQFGFADTARFSTGLNGGKTRRHSMALANARYYGRGRFFWDDRAESLETQTLMPIQDTIEMGLPLADLVEKLRVTPYYAPLFTAAFGSADISTERVAKALAQYIRGIVSYGSRFDSSFGPGAVAPDLDRFTPQERQGLALFNGQGRCSTCHATNAHVVVQLHNTGLDSTFTDIGGGEARFKSPSLRNVAVRGRFMHDGRFTSLQEVVDFYNAKVQTNPGLDPRLRVNGLAVRLNLTQPQRDAIVAFLHTLTDKALLSDERFSDPFPP